MTTLWDKDSIIFLERWNALVKPSVHVREYVNLDWHTFEPSLLTFEPISEFLSYWLSTMYRFTERESVWRILFNRSSLIVCLQIIIGNKDALEICFLALVTSAFWSLDFRISLNVCGIFEYIPFKQLLNSITCRISQCTYWVSFQRSTNFARFHR